MSCLLYASSPQFRDDVYHNILTSDLPNLLEHGNITALTQLWSSGQISNFEYLTHLNKHAGRSFNDLMQYPVFPFILRDYTSETLDLQDSGIYRSDVPATPFDPHLKWTVLGCDENTPFEDQTAVFNPARPWWPFPDARKMLKIDVALKLLDTDIC